MKRLLLDTNIYGLMSTDPKFHQMHTVILDKKKDFLIYGFVVVRKELKEAPRKSSTGLSIRAALLHAYDRVVTKEYPLEPLFEELAEAYYKAYCTLGGGYSHSKLFPDFLIVACASVKGIALVVSEDNATLRSEIALKSYENVNTERKIPLPELIGYQEFKELILP